VPGDIGEAILFQACLSRQMAIKAVLVILVEAGHLREVALLDQFIDDQPGLVGKGGQISHMPLPGDGPEAGQAGGEDVWDLLLFEIFLDRRGGGRPEMPHHDEDFIPLHQAFGIGHRFGWLIDMVVRNELDLSPVDATGLIDPIEDGFHAGLDVDPPIGDSSREVHPSPDNDFLVRHPSLGPGEHAPAQDQHAHEGDQQCTTAKQSPHPTPPSFSPEGIPDMWGRETLGIS
jgi:hypothetical protein